MAERLESLLSLDDICRSLAGFPQGSLLALQRKLQQEAPSNSRALLEAIILKSLGQPTPALELLKSIPNIKAAQYIAHKVQNERLQRRGDQVSPSPRDPDLMQTVEQMYALLQKENIWCDPDQPHTLISKPGFSRSSPSPRVTSPCIPINESKNNNVESLNSNLAISHSPTALFMTGVSQSNHQLRTPSKLLNDTTRSFVQQRGRGDLPKDVDENRGLLGSRAVKGAEKTGFASTGSDSQVFKAPSTERYPVESTDTTGARQQIESVSASNLKGTLALSTVNDAKPVTLCPFTEPVDGASSLKEVDISPSAPSTPSLPIEDTSPQDKTEVKKFPSSDVGLPSTESESTEDGFFSFVILHVQEDDEIASRVKSTLESLGVKNGTTFCDGFVLPGSYRLNCLEEAVNNSAFTVLLLTKRWTSNWANFQTNAVLMKAIESRHKYNTVIPFLPCTDKLQRNRMPLCLQPLIALDESSPKFSDIVQRTFPFGQIEKQKNIWRKEEAIRVMKEKTESIKLEADKVQQMQEANKDWVIEYQKYLLYQSMAFTRPNVPVGVPGCFPPFSRGEPPFQHTQRMPGTVPPAGAGFPFYPMVPFAMYDMPSHFDPTQIVSSMGSSGAQGTQYASGGQHPVIQIQHASNVQIGDRNQMTIEREGEKSEEEEQEEAEGQSATLS